MRPVALAAIAAGLTLSTLLGAADGASSSSETSQAGNGKIAFATAAFLVEGNIAPGGIEAEPTAFPGRNGAILAGGGANGKLYSLSADGRRRTVIRGIRTAWVGGGSAAWSPDGTRLAFARYGGGIAIADASSRHPIRVTERGREPAWSPDGSQLVFTQGSSLYLVRADGRGLRRLFPGRNAQWSPDGSRIAFQLHDEGTGGGDSIYVSALDGSQRLRLATGGIPSCVPGLIHNQEPAWTPDGSRIAYSTWLWCGNNADASIGAVSPDGSQHWTLVKPQGYPGGASAPVWSPDGRALAYFESYDDGGASDGLSVLPLGGKARRIARDWQPFEWSPVF